VSRLFWRIMVIEYWKNYLF